MAEIFSRKDGDHIGTLITLICLVTNNNSLSAKIQLIRAFTAASTRSSFKLEINWELQQRPATVAPFKLPPLLHNERCKRAH